MNRRPTLCPTLRHGAYPHPTQPRSLPSAGLSLSVCTELLRGKQGALEHLSSPKTNKVVTVDPTLIARRKSAPVKSDDISALCCSHGLLKDLCRFCRDDPAEPDYTFGNVWRERVDPERPGHLSWVREPRVEKVSFDGQRARRQEAISRSRAKPSVLSLPGQVRKRNPFGLFTYKRFDESDEEEEEEEEEVPADKTAMAIDAEGRPLGRLRLQTPPPAPLTPKGLALEVALKHYSRHQVKPKAMFTFHCMQVSRRAGGTPTLSCLEDRFWSFRCGNREN